MTDAVCKEFMPKVPTHALIWSREHGVYELRPADPHLSSVVPGEEEPWFAWVSTHASFSFQGQAARQALDELEQLVQRERFGIHPRWLPSMRARLWLAQGQLREASDWAASLIFPEELWGGTSFDGAFPLVMRVYFAERRWQEALELLDSWSGRLDRPANLAITITYLAQSLVALHQAGKSEQARVVAARLLALTEPEGYVRVYLDEGELMRQALQALLTPHAQQHALAASTTTYVAKLLDAFE